MATSFRTDAGGLWAEQRAGSDLDYTLDWSDALDDGDGVAASAWAATAGVAVDRFAFDDAATTAWVSGGIAGRWYTVTNTVTTGAGRVFVRSFRVYVSGPVAQAPSVFGDLSSAVASLRRDRLMALAQTWLAGVSLTDEYLLGKLLAAERTVERRLRVFLTPREIVPDGAPQAEIDALEASGERVEFEPGYDHAPGDLGGSAWGMVHLRQRPVSAVRSVVLSYPSGLDFPVPQDWIRADKKYGVFQLVPVQLSAGMTLSGMVLSALSAGMGVPLAVKVRYRAGLEDAADRHPDILSLVKKMAVLDALEDLFLPSGGSTSVDGLSQGFQLDLGSQRGGLEDALDRMRQSLHGIRLAVL